MPQVARLIGGAGTGKTSEIISIMEGVFERVVDPHLVGFSSFTKAACNEAATRACDRFGYSPRDLVDRGWFRTLHSVAFQSLAAARGDLIDLDTKADRLWLGEALQAEIAAPLREGYPADVFEVDSSLAIWERCRNRLEPLETVWREEIEVEDRTPDLGFIQQTIARYEQAKRLDGRMDFTDMLARYAGKRLSIEGAEPCEPDGTLPNVEAWFFDEWQDSSELMQATALRLISADSVRFVYVAGDPFQSIYRFNGASPKHLRGWKVDKSRIMRKSWRCPAEILDLGERILSECSDYFDREIRPADHDGMVERLHIGDLTSSLDPREDWLVLARTNFLARQIGKMLDNACIPWTGTRSTSTWQAPTRNAAIQALLNLEAGAPIDGSEWQNVLKHINTKANGHVLLEHGTKSRWEALTSDQAQDMASWVTVDDLATLGATEALKAAVTTRQWRSWIPQANEYDQACQRWGNEAVAKPGVKVGTVHSVKGCEADNVAVITTISTPVARSAKSPEGADEEKRVKYVAATRARKKLLVIDNLSSPLRWRMPL